jgi:hypothetical protein
MIKRVNFTGRRRIPQDRVAIEVHDGTPRTFDAAINLDGMQLLAGAAVFLEAMCAGSTVIERFEFGKVGDIVPPRDRRLKELSGQNVFFSLKVVDRQTEFGSILGIADNIRPQRAGVQTVAGRQGILPVEPKDLGQQMWKLDFTEHGVFLLVNEDVPELIDLVRSDPLFYAVVYPEIVRRVLDEAIKQNVDAEDEEDRWPVLWLRFGKNLHAMRESPPPKDASDEEKDEWVGDVIDAFCKTHTLKDKYAATLAGNNGGEV